MGVQNHLGTAPWVTVGIPTYNRPELLRRSLQRLASQTYKNFEILISDNCSVDEEAIRNVVEHHSQSLNIKYVRQHSNLGAIRNLKYLLDHAKHSYFMWAADDDFLEATFIEKMVGALEVDQDCVLAMPGYDVTDKTTDPIIKVVYTQYLKKLPAPDLFDRLWNYTTQPEYYGKIRILWGLGRTEVFRQAFAASLKALENPDLLKWHLLPIEMRILLHGNLKIVDEVLLHAEILPTSDGKRQSTGELKKMVTLCNESFLAYNKVIDEIPLPWTKKILLRTALNYQKAHSMIRVVPYYFLQDHFPSLARTIKYFWFKIFVGLK